MGLVNGLLSSFAQDTERLGANPVNMKCASLTLVLLLLSAHPVLSEEPAMTTEPANNDKPVILSSAKNPGEGKQILRCAPKEVPLFRG